VLGIWNLEFGTWNLVLGIWYLDFGIWNLVLGIWILVLGILFQNPKGFKNLWGFGMEVMIISTVSISFSTLYIAVNPNAI